MAADVGAVQWGEAGRGGRRRRGGKGHSVSFSETVIYEGAMARPRSLMPSLNALAAFEAAARHRSISLAAAEMNITPGAVSKQVRLLEEDIGRPLFVRLHRALALTPEGETVAAALGEAFDRIAVGVGQARAAGDRRNVSLGTTMAFAQLWLMPRLGSFWNLHQDIVVDHVISDRAPDLHRPDLDLCIRYGDGDWPEENAARMFGDRILAVAAPGFAEAHALGGPDDLAGAPLLSVEGVDWTWTTWGGFLEAVGAPPRRRLAVRRFNSYVIALQAARDGQGVALGWASLVDPLIRSGALERVTTAEIAAPQSFYVTWSKRRAPSRQAEILRDWLLDQSVEFSSCESSALFA